MQDMLDRYPDSQTPVRGNLSRRGAGMGAQRAFQRPIRAFRFLLRAPSYGPPTAAAHASLFWFTRPSHPSLLETLFHTYRLFSIHNPQSTIRSLRASLLLLARQDSHPHSGLRYSPSLSTCHRCMRSRTDSSSRSDVKRLPPPPTLLRTPSTLKSFHYRAVAPACAGAPFRIPSCGLAGSLAVVPIMPTTKQDKIRKRKENEHGVSGT